MNINKLAEVSLSMLISRQALANVI